MKKITKAVFPVAGMGSRFLPATKATAKEMLPVVDKPLIQYAVEEAVAAGITDMVFITGRNKRAIEDHFDKAYELEATLEAQGKTELLRIVHEVVPKNINCIYIRQAEPLGLGHAVLCALPVIQNEPFAVILADDLIDGEPAVVKQMVEVFARHQCSVLGVQDVPRSQTGQYGIVSVTNIEPNLEQVRAIVEKPKPEDAPSTLAVVGRYILTPRIFHHLAHIKPGAGGEIQLTDALAEYISKNAGYGCINEGAYYDCGDKLEYVKAIVNFSLKRKEFRAPLKSFLKKI